jgi:16S rRNA (guanine1516-N2)-methyltransferase
MTPCVLLVCRAREAEGRALGERLGLAVTLFDPPLKQCLKALPTEGAALALEPDGLGLYALDLPGSGAVRVDLEAGAMGWRLGADRARHETVVKACGLLKAKTPVTIFDATPGLLRDACVLAAAGARVVMAERAPVVAALVENGLHRAAAHAELQPLLSLLDYRQGDSLQVLAALAAAGQRPDVVYLDPMFPHRDKSALVKKEMRAFRAVVGDDADADALLPAALLAATKRVVVKRPRGAPLLGGRAPGLVLEGKSARFDVYLLQ